MLQKGHANMFCLCKKFIIMNLFLTAKAAMN